MRANFLDWCRSRASLMAAAAMVSGLSALLAPAAVLAGPQADARVQEILDGNELYIDQQQAEVNQLSYRPALISTKQSRASLALSSGAQARINKNSQLRLGSTCARLIQGQMLISGKQTICVGSVQINVRGTHYIVEALDDGSTEVAVLDGQLTFTPSGTAKALPPGWREFAEREVLRFGPDGQLVSRRCMLAVDYRRYLASDLVQGFFFPLPQLQALVTTLKLNVPGATPLLVLLNTGGNRGLLGLPFGTTL